MGFFVLDETGAVLTFSGGTEGDRFWCFTEAWKVLVGFETGLVFPTEAAAAAEIEAIMQTIVPKFHAARQHSIVPTTAFQLPDLPAGQVELLRQGCGPRKFSEHLKGNLFIVKTHPDQPFHHGGLHTNTSRFVMCAQPSPGDEICYALAWKGSLHFEIKEGSGGEAVSGKASLRAESYLPFSRDTVQLRVTSHLGRSVMLGEDGAEHAFGNEMLGTLWCEVLNRAAWSYAPVQVEELPEPRFEDFPNGEGWDQAFKEWYRSADLQAVFSPGTGWALTPLPAVAAALELEKCP